MKHAPDARGTVPGTDVPSVPQRLRPPLSTTPRCPPPRPAAAPRAAAAAALPPPASPFGRPAAAALLTAVPGVRSPLPSRPATPGCRFSKAVRAEHAPHYAPRAQAQARF
eukprot:gene7845-5222_t